jgi:MFS family permease
VVAAVGYAGAGLIAFTIPRRLLGPDFDPARPRVAEAVRHVVAGLREGLRHLAERRPAAYSLLAIAGHRFFYGLSTVAAVLLYRNYFHGAGESDAAFDDLALLIGLSGLGFVAAAVVTPAVVEHLAPPSWIVLLLALAAVVQVFPAGLYTQPALLVAGFFLGFAAQGVKICVDTLVQLGVDDAFRGRVFAVYDVLFNVAFVSAAAVAAAVVPEDGYSYAVLVATALGYAATAAAYARSRRVPASQRGRR